MKHLAFRTTLPQLCGKDDGWDFDNLITFNTFQEFETYLLMVQKNNKPAAPPDSVISGDDHLQDDYTQYYGYRNSESDTENIDSE